MKTNAIRLALAGAFFVFGGAMSFAQDKSEGGASADLAPSAKQAPAEAPATPSAAKTGAVSADTSSAKTSNKKKKSHSAKHRHH